MYGETFDENKFEYGAFYVYYISFPTNIANLTESYPGLVIVMQFYADVSLYVGTEYITIDSWGHTGDYDYDYGRGPEYERIFKSGNVSIKRKYAGH